MNEDIDKIKEKIKQKRTNITLVNKIKKERHPLIYKYINRLLIIIVLTLITLIGLKANTNFRNFFYKHVFDTNFSFAKVNEMYEKRFGSPIPFKNLFQSKVAPVFNEKLEYKESRKYKDGVSLVVDNNYLVPALNKGIVIFIGDKDEYENTVIIQQSDGVDVWYSNINNISIKLYDYVETGSLVGETINNNLYLVFKKDGLILDYKKYI